jgi:C4-dicarboxylate-specific signal transduction histidine kinase
MKPHPPSSSTGSPDGSQGTGRASEEERQTLHGQMLHVSRLATVGEMAAGIAHELNQPLAAITNYAHACERLLGRPDADLAEVREALRQISAEAIRAGDILRRLRTLARSHTVQRSPADINAVIREIAELLEGDARAHRARLVLELTEPLPRVLIDAAQVQHVLLNLARNGFEAMAPGGAAQPDLLIRTGHAEAQTVEVAVCDNGPGLTALALERLFDPFFSTKDEGTGLGLPISNTLIRAQGGTLGYRPNLPVGACFYFRLPVEGTGTAQQVTSA